MEFVERVVLAVETQRRMTAARNALENLKARYAEAAGDEAEFGKRAVREFARQVRDQITTLRDCKAQLVAEFPDDRAKLQECKQQIADARAIIGELSAEPEDTPTPVAPVR